MAVRKKRSISIPPELDAEIAAAAQAAGMSSSAWIGQTERKEFVIRAGLEEVSQYEAEHGPFTRTRSPRPTSGLPGCRRRCPTARRPDRQF
jgi:hypothetical protein